MFKMVSACSCCGGRSFLETPSQSRFSQCPFCVFLVILALSWGQGICNYC